MFFNEFPSSFDDMYKLYGPEGNPLYDVSFFHIYRLFFLLNNIGKTDYYNKIIKVSIGGKWDADAVSHFQSGLWETVFDDKEFFLSQLEAYSEKEIESFFYFFFDGIHPRWKTIPAEIRSTKQANEKVYRLMEKALMKVWANHKEAH